MTHYCMSFLPKIQMVLIINCSSFHVVTIYNRLFLTVLTCNDVSQFYNYFKGDLTYNSSNQNIELWYEIQKVEYANVYCYWFCIYISTFIFEHFTSIQWCSIYYYNLVTDNISYRCTIRLKMQFLLISELIHYINLFLLVLNNSGNISRTVL